MIEKALRGGNSPPYHDDDLLRYEGVDLRIRLNSSYFVFNLLNTLQSREEWARPTEA